MNHQGKKTFQVITIQCSLLIGPLKNALAEAGLWTFQSFDLQSTRALHEDCSCPHHGTSQCTCELVVLLVYEAESDPITLFLDGRNGQTFLFIVEEPGVPLRPSTVEALECAVKNAVCKLPLLGFSP